MSSEDGREWIRGAGRLCAVLFIVVSAAVAAAEVLRDPTRPARTRAADDVGDRDAGSLHVQSVWLSGRSRFAVVGDRRVEPGDRIAGGRIVAIDLDGVHVRRPDGDVVLRIAGRDPKRSRGEGKRR